MNLIRKKLRSLIAGVWLAALVGCAAPRERLTFPAAPMASSGGVEWFDVDRDGRRDFAIADDTQSGVELRYDDDQDGNVDRIYRLDEYRDQDVPHVILLLDSVPFETARRRFEGGDMPWFGKPVKLIAPFPSLTEVCYSDVLRAPPLPGAIDQYYDPRSRRISSAFWRRVGGYREPWERRCDYVIGMTDGGLSFLDPRGWYAAELERARKTIERSADRVTIVYTLSASGMACKFGEQGVEEVLDGAARLCRQLLYERHGAIKITMMADHGHNYATSTNVRLDRILAGAGFHISGTLANDDDAVIEINGLVTDAGVVTRRPVEAANALLKDDAIELAMYLQGDRVIVRSARGAAAVESRGGKVRYVPIDADVLDLSPVVRRLEASGAADADGYADDATWFDATLDHPWPNAPRRIWDALHRQVVNPGTVLLSIRDGRYAGLPAYERFIKMKSTHGGLNQINSATFLMTMLRRPIKSVPHTQVLEMIEPGFEPRVHGGSGP